MKKITLLCLFVGLILCGCSGCSSENNKPYKGLLNDDRNQIEADRIQVTSRVGYAGDSIIVFFDTKTGREFLSYDNAMVEIKPKDEK